MKKSYYKFFILGCVVTLVMTAKCPIFAESASKTINVIFGQVKIFVNGKQIEKVTLLYDGRTYLPLRDTADALGMEVAWDEKTSSAYIDDIGTNRQAQIDGIALHTPSPTPKPTPKPTVKPTPTATPEPIPSPTPTLAPEKYSYYSEDKRVVDFGKMFDVGLHEKRSDFHRQYGTKEYNLYAYTYLMENLPSRWYKEYMKALEDAGFVYDYAEKQKSYYRGAFRQDDTLVLISDDMNERISYIGNQKTVTPPYVRVELRILED